MIYSKLALTLTYMHATRSWAPTRNHKLLLLSHNLIKVSISLLVPLMTEREKGEEKGKIEVGVVVLTEGVIVIIKGVAIMMKTRAPLDMAITVAKGVKATATKVARVTITREARVTANHPTSLPSSLIRTNSRDMASITKTRLETKGGMTVGMETVEAAIVALGVDSLALPAIGVMVFSTIYMGSAIGRANVTLISYVKRVADPMLQRNVRGTNPNL